MKNIFLKLFIFTAIMGFVLIGCQKESLDPVAQDEVTELTPEQLDLKKKMDQAAQVLVQFSNDKEAMAEVQKMIDLKMYHDDYVKFKDLFQPESNDKLKSFGTTKFAKRFRENLSTGKFKSSDGFDLEQFLIDNDLVLYIPYPVEDYPADKQTPTISFHPLDNDSVNIGYRLSLDKSTNNVQLVSTVDEEYSEGHPVFIIKPDDGNTGGGNTGGGNTGGGNTGGGTHTLVKIVDMLVTEQLDGFFSGGSEIYLITAGSVAIDDKNHIAGEQIHLRGQYNYTRRDIRKENYHNLNINFDPDWTEQETTNYIAAVEIDSENTYTLGASVTYKFNDKISSTVSFSVKITNGHDFIGYYEMPRYYFMQSQANPSMFGLGTHNGNPERTLGSAIKYTTKVIKY